MRGIELISHRGLPSARPEHTLASYEEGIRQGGDFIEIDLVATRDGHLIARHEAEIGHTTDVGQRSEFADRRAAKTIDGKELSGFFAEDFTLAEIAALRVVERIPEVRPHNTRYDGAFEIPAFPEIIALAKRLTSELGRPVGLYPETKHPAYHAAIGLELEPPLIAALREHGLAGPEPEVPVYLQSFGARSLRTLGARVSVPLVRLMHAGGAFDPVATPEGLAEVAAYAHAIGPDKSRIIPRDADGNLAAPTPLVKDAHAAGLLVHPYTFRSENTYLPAELRAGADPNGRGDALSEYRAFFEAGVDGVFTDDSGAAHQARAEFQRR